jgi:hypothetical protein
MLKTNDVYASLITEGLPGFSGSVLMASPNQNKYKKLSHSGQLFNLFAGRISSGTQSTNF